MVSQRQTLNSAVPVPCSAQTHFFSFLHSLASLASSRETSWTAMTSQYLCPDHRRDPRLPIVVPIIVPILVDDDHDDDRDEDSDPTMIETRTGTRIASGR